MFIVTRASRGQTLIETAIVLPLVLLTFFAVVYFSNLGIVYERTQIATRFGAQVGFGGNPRAYSAAAIYTASAQSTTACASPAPGIFSNSDPFPGPTSAPYWHPDWAKTSSTCQAAMFPLVGAQFLASRYISFGTVSVNAQSVMPGPLPNFMPGITAGVTSSSMRWVHSAWPAIMLACTKKMAPAVQEALTADGTSPITNILPAQWPPACPK